MTTSHDEVIRHLSAADERLSALIARVGPCLIMARAAETDHFEGLVRAITSQQLSTKAAATIFGRLKALGLDETGTLNPKTLLSRDETLLRGAGLSGQKTRYIRDVCEKVSTGALSLDTLHAIDDEAVIAALCSVKGVGRWTAEMFLMFRLGRPDVLPVGDLGIQKGFMKLFGLKKMPTPEKMMKLAKPFQPYRSAACWYLWRLTEEKDGEPPR
ncbi:MAG: DNA-3-methyladenine glycosylase [Byssovorax sp.]